MNIVVTKEKLKEALDLVSRVNTSRETLPILKNILFRAEKEKIVVTGTNLEIAITSTLSGKIIENGSITVPGQFLSQIINTIPQERIALISKEGTLEITTDNYSANVQGSAAEDFPIIPKIKNNTEFVSFSGEVLKSALEKVTAAAQFSDLRPELNSVLFTFSLGAITLVATDSFRLAEKKIQEQFFSTNIKKEFQFLVPLRTAQEITRILSEKDEVKMYRDENQVSFDAGRWNLISRLVEGTFPDYHAVVPKDFDAEISLSHEEFLNAVKTVAVFGSKTQEIHIRQGKQKKALEVFSRDETLGENTYLVSVDTKGEFKEINFNWRYLLDGLRSLDGKEISFGLNEENKPAILKSPGDTTFFYLLMPIVKR